MKKRVKKIKAKRIIRKKQYTHFVWGSVAILIGLFGILFVFNQVVSIIADQQIESDSTDYYSYTPQRDYLEQLNYNLDHTNINIDSGINNQ